MITIITYNVHNFQNTEKKYNYGLISKDIIRENPDLLFLNESNQRNNQLENLAKRMDAKEMLFCPTNSPNFGNTIISKYDVLDCEGFLLPHNRCGLFARIDCKVFSTIGVVHLDHTSEKKRLTQYDAFIKKVSYPELLCGDFNAYLRQDYTDDQWSDIENERKEKGWEKPQSILMEKVKKNYKILSSSFTAHVQNPRYRIDYICIRNDVYERIKVLSCATLSCSNSDHFPVKAEILPVDTDSTSILSDNSVQNLQQN